MFADSHSQTRRKDSQRRHALDRRLHLESLEDRRVLATLVVTDLGDDTLANLAGDGQLSLREAIEAVNLGAPVDGISPAAGSFGNNDTILFSASLFADSPKTISMSAGQFELTSGVTIFGPQGNLLTIDAQQNSRIFDITSSTGNFNFEQLTLTGGMTTGLGQQGGAIRSMSTWQMNIFDTNIIDNRTTGNFANGGGVWTMGYASFRDSTVANNRTEGTGAGGGGVFAFDRVDFTSSLIADNQTLGGFASGGGVSANGRVGLNDTTVARNQAMGSGSGAGGILGVQQVSVIQSTISGNQILANNTVGAGVSSEGPITVDFSTIVDNHALGSNSVGGGVRTTSASVIVRGSIIANNSADSFSDVSPGSGSLTAEYSLIGDTAGLTIAASTNLLGVDPELGPLSGLGRALTHAPLTGSPVIDSGDPSPLFVPAFDQRGEPFLRVVDGDENGNSRSDMGAHELQFASADFNADGDVNGQDFLIWQRGFGISNPDPSDGDSDNDGDVDNQDLLNWQQQYRPFIVGLNSLASAPPSESALDAVLGVEFGGADSEEEVPPSPVTFATEAARDQAFAASLTTTPREAVEYLAVTVRPNRVSPHAVALEEELVLAALQ